MRFLSHFIFIICLFTVENTYSAATFGPEWEFTSDTIENAWHNGKLVKMTSFEGQWAQVEDKEAERFASAIAQLCGSECKVTPTQHKHKTHEYLVTFPDGFWFRISYDPKCIEIQMKPLTLEQLQDPLYSERINKYVFNVAKAEGYYTNEYSEGHFNIGFFSMFGRDKRGFLRALRFISDFENHAEIWMGGLGGDRENSPPLAMQSARARENLLIDVTETVHMHIQFETTDLLSEIFGPKEDIGKIMMDLLAENVYLLSNNKNPLRRNPDLHNQALSLEDVIGYMHDSNKNQENRMLWEKNFDIPGYQRTSIQSRGFDLPIEIRALRAQENLHEFILLAELFTLRERYVNSEPDRPGYYLERKLDRATPEQMVSRFYVYVTEAGGSFRKFKQLLLPALRKVQPDKFVTGKYTSAVTERDYQVLKNHLPFIAFSPMIKQMFDNIFNDPQTKEGPWGVALKKEIANLARVHQLKGSVLEDLYLDAVKKYTEVIPEPMTKREQELKNKVDKLNYYKDNWDALHGTCLGLFF